MGPFVLLNVTLIGFFGFAAAYHLMLWWVSRRETLLIAFAADCAVRAIFCSWVVTLATARTLPEAQFAMHTRISVGMLMMLTWVWCLTLIADVRLNRYVDFIRRFLRAILVIHIFFTPLNANVIGIEQYQLPWGETITNPQLAPPGWWVAPIYMGIVSIEIFGLRCGLRVWKRDRSAGLFVLLASCTLLILHTAHLLKLFGLMDVPFVGAIGHVFWACMVALLIGRRDQQLREKLVSSEQRFRGIFDQTFDLIGLMKTDGTVIGTNHTALEFAGLQLTDVVGKPFWETPWWSHSQDQRDCLRQAIAKASEGQIARFEATHRDRMGNLSCFDFSLKPVRDEHGQITLLISEARDIEERKRIDAELRSSRQRSEALSRQLITAQETERRVLARELHDEIGQVLTAIKMNLRRTQRASDSKATQQLEENVSMVDQAIGQVRNLSLSLRPPHLDELGLVAAIHWLVQHQARAGGFEPELDVDLGEAQIPPELETICFRIAQEALTNAVRHGAPSKVRVQLRASITELSLCIHDDGVGFDIEETFLRATQGGSFGLTSMEERASLAGGVIRFESTSERGTTIQVGFPLVLPSQVALTRVA